jgi:hypothetical protein
MTSKACLFGVFLFAAGFDSQNASLAQELPKYRGITDQRRFPDSINSCAPASVLNLLKFSREEYRDVYKSLVGSDDGIRMRFVVDRYFRSRPSVVYPKLNRWGVHGIQSEDLVVGLNEMFKDEGARELKGLYLDRREGENEDAHLLRVHDLLTASIGNGVTPILSLRSFVVRKREGKEAGWETGAHHNVVVVEVKGKPNSIGFEVIALDPYQGRQVEILIHREANKQQFLALKGIEESDLWLEGTPFLQILAPKVPTVRPGNLKWSERYLVVANFVIGDF